MTTYTKETALYDTGAISTDIQNAGKRADSYMSFKSGVGLMVADMTTSGMIAPDSADLDTNHVMNTLTTSTGYCIRDGRKNLAEFTYGELPEAGYEGTIIYGSEKGISLVPNKSAGRSGLSVYGSDYDEYGYTCPYVKFGFSDAFSPEPIAVAVSTNSNISLTASNPTPVKIPMSDIDFEQNNNYEYDGDEEDFHDIFSVKNGNTELAGFDTVPIEVSASIYVATSATALVKLYLYKREGGGSWVEVASASSMMTAAGGAIQMIPRVIRYCFVGDEFYIGARVFGSGNTATVYCNNKDTWLQFRFV